MSGNGEPSSGPSITREAYVEQFSARAQFALDALLGTSVGDALGAYWEGSNPALSPRELEPRLGGRLFWTDDTQMAISVTAVLLAHGRVDQDALAAAFVTRFQPQRGYGGGSMKLLRALQPDPSMWRSLSRSMFDGRGSHGNGAGMRVAPLGAYFSDDGLDHVVEEATRSAEVTHAHPEAATGAAAVAVAGALMALGRNRPAEKAEGLFEAVRRAIDATPGDEVKRSLERAQRVGADRPMLNVVEGLGNGSRMSCQDSVAFALWLAFTHQDDFEGAVRSAVDAGGDTDTIAAMTGGLVAARLGREGIPGRWLDCVEPLPALHERQENTDAAATRPTGSSALA